MDLQVGGGRDIGLSLFRALGKFLYGKRHEAELSSVQKPTLPPHLSFWTRPPLMFDVDDVLDQCQMTGVQVIAWLHENYPDFMPHMSATEWVSQHISWVDSYLSGGMNWRLGLTPAADCNAADTVSRLTGSSNGLANRHYGALVLVRALVLSHHMIEEAPVADSTSSGTRARRGFHPLRPPSVHDAWKIVEQRRNELLNLCAYNTIPSDGCFDLSRSIVADRSRWLFDYLPLIVKSCSVTNHIKKDSVFEDLVCAISSFGQTVRSGDRGILAVSSQKNSSVTNPEGICSSEVIAEGDKLLIEEDLSDDEYPTRRKK